MKKNNIYKRITFLFLLLSGMVFFGSCSEENDEAKGAYIDTSIPAPVINAVRTVNEYEEYKSVNQGVLENTYTIHGKNLANTVSISFNGYDAYFNPTFVTDNLIFVTVPEDAPYLGQEDILRVETTTGVTEYPFSLLTIESFSTGNINGRDVVILQGGDFSTLLEVTFDPNTNVEDDEVVAEIAEYDADEITVYVPDGINQAFISVETTLGAFATSESYGFNYPLYIDSLNPDWALGGWSGSQDPASTEEFLGTNSIYSFREAWAGLTFTYTGEGDAQPLVFGNYSTISVQIYGGQNAVSVNLALNDFDSSVTLNLVQGEWTKFDIPLSRFYPNGGAPTTITRIDFQESSGVAHDGVVFYVDDFGLIQ